MKKKEGFLLLVVLYVDDFLINSSSATGFSGIKSALNKGFSMTNFKLLRNFIGLDVSQNTSGIMISQSRYSSYMLKRFHMEDCKESPCPFY